MNNVRLWQNIAKRVGSWENSFSGLYRKINTHRPATFVVLHELLKLIILWRRHVCFLWSNINLNLTILTTNANSWVFFVNFFSKVTLGSAKLSHSYGTVKPCNHWAISVIWESTNYTSSTWTVWATKAACFNRRFLCGDPTIVR